MSNPNRRYETLTEALEELERTDPGVREAARKYDEYVQIALGGSCREQVRAAIAERKRKEAEESCSDT